MAKTGAVWGIDIGQCALKALRCRPNDDDKRVTADGFDYIEYPKILSQPEADAVELVREALQTFLSRNSVKGDRVAISVSGQSGLARFIKLPPVEAKKIPDIVKYEARQQIPFALEDVVWDYQQMAGGSVEEGFALETEVGLFAMKRDQVFRALKPLTEAGIEVDFVQLTPLALYNFTVFDQMSDLPPPEAYDPENPPPSTVVLSLGTDTTDCVVTNGYRVWQRSIPMGGNHFTKALTKELKLTFAKAEHLKRNATKAEDPKAVFQAMRPVFNDLLTEINRSISYFSSVDRNATIGKVLAMGNTIKLPGLQKYLAQNLELDVVLLDEYRGLSGTSVTSAPAFQDNLLSFGVCYGLALQAMGKAKLATNLVPPELLKERMIRAKKPWAVAAVAALLVGCTIGYLGQWSAWSSVKPELYTDAFSAADQVKSRSTSFTTGYEEKVTQRNDIKELGYKLTGHVEARMLWLELLKAIDAALPHETRNPKPPISERQEMYITSIESQHFADLSVWLDALVEAGAEAPLVTSEEDPDAEGASDSTDTSAEATEEIASDEEGSNAGWVIQLEGYHYHNSDPRNAGNQYVLNTLVENLKSATVELPTPDGSVTEKVAIADLGIFSPVLITKYTNVPEVLTEPMLDTGSNLGYDDPSMMGGMRSRPGGPSGPGGLRRPGGPGGPGGLADESMYPPEPVQHKLQRTDFVVQFAWKETPYSRRLENRLAKQRAEEERKKLEAEQLDESSADVTETASIQP